ncbi:hypothetical protein V0U79_06950 [Hyphobacterium sp. HN65]|uniref:Uncharacterized protein n=1 Tax=Hyphobacterium lacteum TaxID=3116575 RepID=A0ABU7LQA7_9PROT|nr:hypothetical protein [Hyphobacterium sp. HN65]MEE2526099.1 hypothetical protein [Hyphobacterium sp. HN65]
MRFAAGAIAALIISAAAVAQNPVQMSVLPSARAGGLNEPITFLATIANGDDIDYDCQVLYGGFFPGAQGGRALYYPWDETNITGPANGVVSIPAGGHQDYIVEITVPNAYFGPLYSAIQCDGPGGERLNIPRLTNVNDFSVNISNSNQPDIITIGATPSGDGVARILEGGPRIALMTLAAINIGDTTNGIIAEPRISNFDILNDNYNITVCEIDASAICIGEEARRLTLDSWENGEVRLFAVRVPVPAELGIPFFPDILRLGLDFVPAGAAALKQPGIEAPQAEWEVRVGGFYNALVAHGSGGDTPDPVQECHVNPGGDVGDILSRNRGVFISSLPDNGNGILYGGIMLADDQADERDRDFVPLFGIVDPSSSSVAMTAHGTGTGNTQVTDAIINMTLTGFGTLNGGIQLTWEGETGQSNDFGSSGQIRCAPAPFGGAIDGSIPVAGSFGNIMINEYSGDDIIEGGVIDFVDGDMTIGEQNFGPVTYFTDENDTAAQIGAASVSQPVYTFGAPQLGFHGFMLGGSWGETNEAAGNDADCLFLVTSGLPDPSAGEGATMDAGVYRLARIDDGTGEPIAIPAPACRF